MKSKIGTNDENNCRCKVQLFSAPSATNACGLPQKNPQPRPLPPPSAQSRPTTPRGHKLFGMHFRWLPVGLVVLQGFVAGVGVVRVFGSFLLRWCPLLQLPHQFAHPGGVEEGLGDLWTRIVL